MKTEEPRSVQLHMEAKRLRDEAAGLQAAASTRMQPLPSDLTLHLTRLRRAAELRRKAGSVLRRARAAAKREGRVP